MGNTAKFHPHTGEPIRPLWIRPDGRAMWPILGASPDDPPSGPPSNPPSDPPADPPSDPPADPPKQPPWGKPENFDAEKAWELIQNLRTEKGDPQRVAQLEQQLTAAQTAQQEQLDTIAKALGLKPDDTPPDPAALTAQVESEQARAREAAVQLAVYRNAAANEANPDALLDSASFLASLADLDPGDAAAVTAAIKAAVEKNPALKAAPATPPFPGGPRKLTGKPDPGPGLPRLRDAYAQSAK